MSDENYLAKLKAIRDKYHSQSNYDYRAVNTEVMYPLSQKMEDKSFNETYQCKVRRSPQKGYLNVSPSRRERINIEVNRERTGFEPKWERSATIEKSNSINYDKLKPHMLSQAQLKRQDNFNHFISDLDQRIEQKEKKLSLKFKQNERMIRHFEETPKEYESLRINRHASTRQIKKQYVPQRTPLLSEKLNLDFLPRSAYEKSRSYKNIENVENEPSRYYKASSPTKYQRSIEDFKDYHYTSSTHNLISKKLEGPLNLSKHGKDGWNPKKLENIQNRIQSVLRQCNR